MEWIFTFKENTFERFNILQVRIRENGDCKSIQYIRFNARLLFQIFFYIDRTCHIRFPIILNKITVKEENTYRESDISLRECV